MELLTDVMADLKPIVREVFSYLLYGLAALALAKVSQLLGVKTQKEQVETAKVLASSVVKAVEQNPDVTRPWEKKQEAVATLEPLITKKLRPITGDLVEAAVREMQAPKGGRRQSDKTEEGLPVESARPS